ncbi:hypothetical protein HanRHA438_Chr03g0136251 [Helianthus annuus]|nr:hypothetical protein HanRHA438_Chr03g0136251 [Helianthus annuus]
MCALHPVRLEGLLLRSFNFLSAPTLSFTVSTAQDVVEPSFAQTKYFLITTPFFED